MSDIKKKLIVIISTILKDSSVEEYLLNDDDLISIGLNSIKFIRLVVEIEKEFNLEFEDDMLDYTNFKSLEDLSEYVAKFA